MFQILSTEKQPSERCFSRANERGWTYQWDNDFAIRMRLEVVLCLQALSQDSVIIDLSVDCQSQRLVVVDQGLSAGVCLGVSIFIPFPVLS